MVDLIQDETQNGIIFWTTFSESVLFAIKIMLLLKNNTL